MLSNILQAKSLKSGLHRLDYLYWALILVCSVVDGFDVVCESRFLDIVVGRARAIMVEDLTGIVLVFEVSSRLKVPERKIGDELVKWVDDLG